MNHLMATWIFWMLGVDLPAGSEGLEWELAGNWHWGESTVILASIFAVLSTSYVIYFYFREQSEASWLARLGLAAIRLSLIALILLVMVFQLQIRFTRMSLPPLAIIVDRSASMDVSDEYKEPAVRNEIKKHLKRAGLADATRWNIARSLLLDKDAERMKDLADRYTPRFFTMAGAAQELSGDLPGLEEELREMDATGVESRLGTSLRSVLGDLRGQPLAAVVVLSDGITTEGIGLADAATEARSQAVPLFLVGIGSADKSSSLTLSDLVVDEIVFVNDYVDFDFKMTPYALAGKEVELILRDRVSGEELDRRRVVAGEDGVATRQKLSDRPTQLGRRDYLIEVANLKEELKDNRPQLSRQVEVRDDPIKVLLVQDAPSFEYKYLKNLLERDRTLDFNVVLQQADIEYPEQDQYALPVFPVSRKKLFEYDVLILGDVNLELFSRRDLENIAAFVKQKGGGLLLSTGGNFQAEAYERSPLAELLPFDVGVMTNVGNNDIDLLEGFQIEPTPLGAASPHMQLGDTSSETAALWKALPKIYFLNAANGLKPNARVLAEHPTRTGADGQRLPVFVIYYLPPGKVLWHGTDETYRWRFRLGDAIYARYWVQAIRYLSRTKLLGDKGVELTADKLEYAQGEPVELRVRFFDERLVPDADDGVAVVVEGEGKRQRVPLRRSSASREIFEGTMANLTTGDYEAMITKPALEKIPAAANFQVVAPAGEMARIELDEKEMKQAASRSRGRYYDVRNLAQVFDELPPGRPMKIATLPAIPLWNKWQILLLLLLLLVTEWLLRKRLGML
jgi:hypothetical protein